MLSRYISTFAGLASLVAAAIEITPGTSLSGSGLSVKYSGADSDAASIIFNVFTGGDTLENSLPIAPFTQTSPKTSGTITIPLKAGQGPDDKNAYFIQAVENLATGGASTSYSDRFSISGMTGSFPAVGTMTSKEVEAAYKKIASDQSAVPDATEATAPQGAGVGAAVSGDVPAYSLQTTGTMKMAPMQQKPGTKITQKNTKPLYPTSDYKLATTALPMVSFKITQTASQAKTVISRPNTNAPAPEPTDDMQKFLNRWKD